MKKGIRAIYTIPKEYYFLLDKHFEIIEDYLREHFEINFGISLSEIDGQDYTEIIVELFNDTFMEVEKDLQDFKYYMKDITGRRLKQMAKLKFEKI